MTVRDRLGLPVEARPEQFGAFRSPFDITNDLAGVF